MTDTTNPALLAMLTTLRRNFRQGLADRIDDIESLVLGFGASGDPGAGSLDLYRAVHSLKGTAGTHGYHSLSTVCHQFEEWLTQVDKAGSFNESARANTLACVDLLRQIQDRIDDVDVDATWVDQQLTALRQRLFGAQRRALVVESSRLGREIVEKTLVALGVQVSLAGDGLEALERLLRERFDLIVVARETPVLNGPALLCALRHAGGMNASAATILISASPGTAGPELSPAPYVVVRGQDLPDQLDATVRRCLGI
jgi:CheY-like chemotaxis protein